MSGLPSASGPALKLRLASGSSACMLCSLASCTAGAAVAAAETSPRSSWMDFCSPQQADHSK